MSSLAGLKQTAAFVLEPPRQWQRFLAAALSAVLSIGASLATALFADVSPYAPIVLGMAGVTWYAGLRLGLVATAVAAALSWIVVVRSGAIPETVEAGSLHLAIAILVAAVVCFLTDGLHRSLRTSASLLQRQRELLDEVIAREEGTRVLADGVSKLVAYVDARGRYRFTNRTFEDWFGVPGKDLEGRDEAEFLGEPAYEQVKPFVNAALAGQRVSFDAVIPYRLGGTRSVHSDYVPDIAASGKVRGYFAITADETERRQYEEQLAESEARSRGILNASLDGLIITNEDGIILSLNPAAERLFGYAQNELVGQQVNVLVPPSARKAHDPRHWANTSSGHSDILGKGRDLTGVTKGGQVFPAHVAVGEIITGSGRLFTCTIHDLTERVRAEDQLRLSERRYRSLVEATTSVVWTADADAQVVEPQPDWERYTGQLWPDYRGAGFTEMVHPDDRDALMQRWQIALASRTHQAFPARVWHADSESWRHCETFAVPLKSENGAVVEWIGTTNDVEDRYQVMALDDLRATDERTRLAESVARLGMWEWDLNAKVVWTEGLTALFDLAQGAAPSIDTLRSRLHRDDRARFAAAFRDAARRRRGIDEEFRLVKRDGSVRWLHCRASLMPASEGHLARIVGIFVDVTESVTAREAMRGSEQRERFLSDVTKELISSMDVDSLLAEIAQLAVPRLGDLCEFRIFERPERPPVTSGGELLFDGLAILDWTVHPSSTEVIAERLEAGSSFFAPGLTDKWIAACPPDEASRRTATTAGIVSLICVPMVARGKTFGAAAFAMTTSGREHSDADFDLAEELTVRTAAVADNARLLEELRQTAEDLRRANAAKDDFLSQVSHELRTPITIILGNADVLTRTAEKLDTKTKGQAIEDIHVSALRLQRVVENMLLLARLEHGRRIELEPLHLAKVVGRVLDERRRSNPGREFVVQDDSKDSLVLGDSDLVEQVISNIVSNAEKYSPSDTAVVVTIEQSESEVCLDVLDQGAGITPDEADEIFEPFYRSPRTAGSAQGIGVGLAVCKRVVEALHGSIWARPRPGGGSDFGFSLPAATQTFAPAPEGPP